MTESVFENNPLHRRDPQTDAPGQTRQELVETIFYATDIALPPNSGPYAQGYAAALADIRAVVLSDNP